MPAGMRVRMTQPLHHVGWHALLILVQRVLEGFTRVNPHAIGKLKDEEERVTNKIRGFILPLRDHLPLSILINPFDEMPEFADFFNNIEGEILHIPLVLPASRAVKEEDTFLCFLDIPMFCFLPLSF